MLPVYGTGTIERSIQHHSTSSGNVVLVAPHQSDTLEEAIHIMSVLMCELSGESILPAMNHPETTTIHTGSTTPTTNLMYVVTPSGHVCRNDLLRQTLQTNGGYDPFDLERPLNVNECIVLQQSSSDVARLIPPSSSNNSSNNSSITTTLQHLQMQYDNIVLELYDTKQILQQTQQELSLSLYQNDAAVRVIARLKMEHDQFVRTTTMMQQQQQQQVLQNATVTSSTNNGGSVQQQLPPPIAPTTLPPTGEDDTVLGQEEPDAKKMKLSSSDSMFMNQIPESDHEGMIQTWKVLHAARKSQQKMALSLANQLAFPTTTKESGPHYVLTVPDLGGTNHSTVSKKQPPPHQYTTLIQRYDSSSSNNDFEHRMVQVVSLNQSDDNTLFYQMFLHGANEKHDYPTHKIRPLHPKSPAAPTKNDDTIHNGNCVSEFSCCALDVLVPIPSSNTASLMAMVVYSTSTTAVAKLFHVRLYETHPTQGPNVQCLVGQCIIPSSFETSDGTRTSSRRSRSSSKTSNDITEEGFIVDMQMHPDGQHIIVTTRYGYIYLVRYVRDLNKSTDEAIERSGLNQYQLSIISLFTDDPSPTQSTPMSHTFSAGALHPDGLIYVTAMTVTGDIQLWDFQRQASAGSLKYPISESETTTTTTKRREVSSMKFSNNGYHLAVAYQESGLIHIWDLRKQIILVTLNGPDDPDRIEQVMAVQFDDSGKFLAYSGNNKNGNRTEMVLAITTVKKWDRTATFRRPDMEVTKNGLIWNKNLQYIAVSVLATDSSEVSPKVVCFDLV